VFPLNLALPDFFAKLPVGLPGSGHHADKETMPGGNLAKILLRGKLAVRNIDKM